MLWQPSSHKWLSFPPLAWCESVPAPIGQGMAGAPAELGHDQWRGEAPVKGTGMRSLPHDSLAV